MNRQKQLLAVLAVIFVLALIYAFWASPRPQEVATVAKPSSPARPAVEAPVDTPAGEAHVRLDLMTQEREKFAGYQRDIFNYPRIAPPPSPKIKPTAPPPPPLEPTEPATVPEEVERELAQFTFLGFLEKENVKTVFLSTGDEIFLVKKGERFGEGDDFQVTGLTPEMLVIRRGEDPHLITIPLLEQAPLVPSGPSQPIQAFPRSEAGSGDSEAPQGEPPYPEEAPVEEGEELSPTPAEGENVLQPEEGGHEEPQAREEEMRENQMSPPGGAANE